MTHDPTGAVRLRLLQAYTDVLRTALTGGEAEIAEAVETLTSRELARLADAMERVGLIIRHRQARQDRLRRRP